MWQCFRCRPLISTTVVLVTFTASALGIAGCAAGYRVEPDRTTYPRDLIRKEHVKMPILPGSITGRTKTEITKTGEGTTYSHQGVTQGRPFLEFEQTVTGDSATHEIRIVPKKGEARDEASLLAKAPEAARRICGQGYSITSTKYYNGTEATSGFLGIPHPWLKVDVRCPLRLHTQNNPVAELIASVSKEVPAADHFDIHQKDYTFGVAQLRAVVEKVLSARGMSIMKSFQSSDMEVIVTDLQRSGMIGFPVYEQLIAVLAQGDKGSVLTARLLAYNRDFEGRSNATGSIRLVPMPRDFAYQRIQSFLGEIAKAHASQ